MEDGGGSGVREKILKILRELIVCIIFLAAALLLAYIGYSILFGSLGEELKDIINSLLG